MRRRVLKHPFPTFFSSSRREDSARPRKSPAVSAREEGSRRDSGSPVRRPAPRRSASKERGRATNTRPQSRSPPRRMSVSPSRQKSDRERSYTSTQGAKARRASTVSTLTSLMDELEANLGHDRELDPSIRALMRTIREKKSGAKSPPRSKQLPVSTSGTKKTSKKRLARGSETIPTAQRPVSGAGKTRDDPVNQSRASSRYGSNPTTLSRADLDDGTDENLLEYVAPGSARARGRRTNACAGEDETWRTVPAAMPPVVPLRGILKTSVTQPMPASPGVNRADVTGRPRTRQQPAQRQREPSDTSRWKRSSEYPKFNAQPVPENESGRDRSANQIDALTLETADEIDAFFGGHSRHGVDERRWRDAASDSVARSASDDLLRRQRSDSRLERNSSETRLSRNNSNERLAENGTDGHLVRNRSEERLSRRVWRDDDGLWSQMSRESLRMNDTTHHETPVALEDALKHRIKQMLGNPADSARVTQPRLARDPVESVRRHLQAITALEDSPPTPEQERLETPRDELGRSVMDTVVQPFNPTDYAAFDFSRPRGRERVTTLPPAPAPAMVMGSFVTAYADPVDPRPIPPRGEGYDAGTRWSETVPLSEGEMNAARHAISGIGGVEGAKFADPELFVPREALPCVKNAIGYTGENCLQAFGLVSARRRRELAATTANVWETYAEDALVDPREMASHATLLLMDFRVRCAPVVYVAITPADAENCPAVVEVETSASYSFARPRPLAVWGLRAPTESSDERFEPQVFRLPALEITHYLRLTFRGSHGRTLLHRVAAVEIRAGR